MIAALQIEIVSGEILRRPSRTRRRPAIAELQFQLFDDAGRDLLLSADCVIERRVHRLRPDVAAAGSVDQLRRDAEPLTRRPHAAHDRERAVGVGGVRRQNAKVRESGQVVDDFIPQALAEVLEIAPGGEIGERHDDDGVAAGERGGDRWLDEDRGLAPLEGRRVAALGQLHDPFVRAPLFPVVANELCAKPPRLHADDRIRPRIERVFLPEHLDADHVFLELGAASCERFVHDEGEEALEPIDLLEGHALEHALELIANRLLGALIRCGRCDDGHLPYPIAPSRLLKNAA